MCEVAKQGVFQPPWLWTDQQFTAIIHRPTIDVSVTQSDLEADKILNRIYLDI